MRTIALALLFVVASCKEKPKSAVRSSPSPSASAVASSQTRAVRSAQIELPLAPRFRPIVAHVTASDREASPPGLGCAGPREACREAAYARVLALARQVEHDSDLDPALDTPRPFPERVEEFVEALDQYAELAEPGDPEAPGMEFLAASTYGRYGWSEEALDRYEAVIRDHPAHQVSGYAANLLLHTLDRTDQQDELCWWAAQLSASTPLLENKPELAATLASILARC